MFGPIHAGKSIEESSAYITFGWLKLNMAIFVLACHDVPAL
jgi:hypothetical protein